MIFSLSLAHLTKLLFIFFSCLALLLPPLPPLVCGSPILSVASSSLSLASAFEPKTISLRQTRAIRSSVGKIIITTTTSTTKTPILLSAAAHNKRLQISKQVAAASQEPQGEITNKSSSSFTSTTTTTSTSTTTSAPQTISRIPNKTIKQLTSKLGYTALGHTTATEAATTEQHHHHRPTKLSSGTTRKATETTLANQQNKYRLPSWFNYERYKRFYGKHYAKSSEDEIHKRIYLRTALKVFEQRALYRAGRLASLASMNELSDLTSEELEAFKGRSNGRLRKPGLLATATELKCCTYDQVYSQIIELLNKTSSGGSDGDLPLSRAFIEELEQKSLVGVGGGNEQVANDDGGNGSGSSSGITDRIDDGNVVVDGHEAIGKLETPSSSSNSDSLLLSARHQQSQASEGPPSLIGAPAARRKSMRTPDGGNGNGNLSKWGEPYQQQQQLHQIGSIRDHIGQVSESGSHHYDNRALNSNLNSNLQTNETANEPSLELVSSSERPNMDSSGAVAGSNSTGRLLGQPHRHEQLQHSQRANGTLLEGKPVIEYSNNNNNNKSGQQQQQPQPPNSRPDPQNQASPMGSIGHFRKQSALMGLANEADEKQQMKSLTSRVQQQQQHQKQLPARTGNGSLTIGETANGARKASSQFLDGYHHHHPLQQQQQQSLWQNEDDEEFVATSQRLATSMRLNSISPMHQTSHSDTTTATAAPKISTRPMYYPSLTQRLPSNGTMDEKSTAVAAASGAPKTVTSFAGFEGANMGGQPVRRAPVSGTVGRKSWLPASSSDADDDDVEPANQAELGSRMSSDSVSPIGEKNLDEQIGGGPYSTGANARGVTVASKQQQEDEDDQQQQQQQLDATSPFSSSDGLELSQAERAIAESVRRQVELQLSGNSTIGRQLTEQFSAYFGEPVVVKATLDERAVKRALASARGGAKATAAAASPSSSPSPP